MKRPFTKIAAYRGDYRRISHRNTDIMTKNTRNHNNKNFVLNGTLFDTYFRHSIVLLCSPTSAVTLPSPFFFHCMPIYLRSKHFHSYDRAFHVLCRTFTENWMTTLPEGFFDGFAALDTL